MHSCIVQKIGVSCENMSAVVLDIVEKVKVLSREDREELMDILEDIEDNTLADEAIISGDFITEAEHFAMRSKI